MVSFWYNMKLLSCLIWGSIPLVLVLTTTSEGACYNRTYNCYHYGCGDGKPNSYNGTRNVTIYTNTDSNTPTPWCYIKNFGRELSWSYCYRNCSDTLMKIEIFDSAGMPSPLNYDGGRIVVTCYNIKDPKRNLLIASRATNNSPQTLANSTNQYQISYSKRISGSMSGLTYICQDGSPYADRTTITNVFCDPTLAPVKVCEKPCEYCQLTTEGKQICSGINWRYYNSNQPTKFPFICPSVIDSRSERCITSHLLDTSGVTFISSSESRCSDQFEFQLVMTPNNHTQILMMSDFTPVDATKLHSTRVVIKGSKYKTLIYQCKAMVNHTTIFDESHEFSKNDGFWNMSNLKKAIMNLSAPTNIYISCSGVDKDENENITAFSTQLLVFRSSDLKVVVTEKDRYKTSEKVIVLVNARATATEGLQVCLKERKGICVPSEPKMDATTESTVACRWNDKSCVATFYVGLFVSSPKQMYMPIYSKTVNLTINTTGTTTQPATTATVGPTAPPTKDHGATTPPTKDHGTCGKNTGMIAALVVMTIIGLAGIIVAVVMGVLWWKIREKVKNDRGSDDKEDEPTHDSLGSFNST